ncbi:hypothetical protein SCLCIDRAFT_1222477, partial [Scleroderma citrinum Foug A]
MYSDPDVMKYRVMTYMAHTAKIVSKRHGLVGGITARLPDDVSAVGPQEEVRIGIGDFIDGCSRRIEGNEKRVQGSRQVECPPSHGGHTMKRILTDRRL